MALKEALISEFEQEMANTRKTLERAPTEKLGWKPHEKSFTLGELAAHMAEIPNWLVNTLDDDELNLKGPFTRNTPTAIEEILAAFDANVAEAKKSLAKVDDAHFAKMWSLKVEDKQLFSMPRAAVARGMIMNHSVHHRGQMTVYLRLLDIPVPAIYGPSADEKSFF